MDPESLTADTPVVDAARFLLAEQLTVVAGHYDELADAPGVTAVHETRKAIRRSFTLIKLFAPYFEQGVLDEYRRGLRALMRRLAPCRDITVYRLRLRDYNDSAQFQLLCLADYWERRQREADDVLRDYARTKAVARFLRRYEKRLNSDDWGEPEPDDKTIPLRVRHVAPALVLQRLGAVRAWGDLLPDTTPEQLHQLRIQFKELRYTLQAFEPLLGESATSIIDLSRRVQDHLGLMNDAAVAAAMVATMSECHSEATVYHTVTQADMDGLGSEFLGLWDEFNTAAVRDQLALAVMHL